MKYLIAGLGNIGSDYEGTRHNIGFEIVNALAAEFKGEWQTKKLGAICEIRTKGRSLILLKPSTFMNLSGKSVRYWMQQHTLPTERILVVVDDISLPFGQLRLRSKGSDGGHNGLRDITESLGTNAYPRLRFGIGNDFGPGRQIDYVLGRFSKEEQGALSEKVSGACKAIQLFATLGIARAMNQVN